MKGRTTRGVSGDRVRVVIDADPLDASLRHRMQPQFVFVTASEHDPSCVDGRHAVCSMLTVKAALKLADAIYELAGEAKRKPRRRTP